MGDWALSVCERQETAQADASRGAANAKGSYVQVFAATAFQYSSINVSLTADGGGGQCYLVDIAIGGAGSEQVIIPNILVDSTRAIYMCDVSLTLPISIPAGVRIAARVQEAGGAGTRFVTVMLTGRSGGSNYGPSQTGDIVNYGAVTASSNGVLVDQGAVANTYGSWVQMTANTSRNHNGIVAVMGTNQQLGSLGDFTFNIQLGIGGAGSEVVIGEFYTSVLGNDNRLQTNVYPISVSVPSGTRLAMRSKATAVTTSARNATAILLGY